MYVSSGCSSAWNLSPTFCRLTHLSRRLRNQNPLLGVTSILPLRLTDCLATPKSQSVFSPTSTCLRQLGQICVLSRSKCFLPALISSQVTIFWRPLPPSSVARRKSSPSPARTGFCQIAPCCQAASGSDLHNSPAWAKNWLWSEFMHYRWYFMCETLKSLSWCDSRILHPGSPYRKVPADKYSFLLGNKTHTLHVVRHDKLGMSSVVVQSHVHCVQVRQLVSLECSTPNHAHKTSF